MFQYSLIALALTAAFGVFQTTRLHSEQNAHKADIYAIRAEAAQAALLTEQATEAYKQRVNAAQSDLDVAKGKIDAQAKLLATTRIDADRLRGSLAAYASGPGTGDTAAACESRAGRLAANLTEAAGLLAEGRQLLVESAEDRDQRVAEERALIEGWPRP